MGEWSGTRGKCNTWCCSGLAEGRLGSAPLLGLYRLNLGEARVEKTKIGTNNYGDDSVFFEMGLVTC